MSTDISLDTRQVSPDLIRQIAAGYESPVDVAAKFGIDELTYRALEQEDWFRQRVATKIAEMEANGDTRKERIAHIYDVILEKTAEQAMLEDTSMGMRMQFLDHLAVMGSLKPTAAQQTGNGNAAASIIIQIGERPVVAPAGPEVHTLDVTPASKKLAGPITLRFSPADNADLGAGMEYDDLG